MVILTEEEFEFFVRQVFQDTERKSDILEIVVQILAERGQGRVFKSFYSVNYFT